MNSSQKIEDIDSNFRAPEMSGTKYDFIEITEAPLQLNGFAWLENERKFCRLPQNVIEKDSELNDGAKTLSHHSSGAAIRFATNSSSIAIRAELIHSEIMPHMPLSGEAGFDLYIKKNGEMSFHRNIKPLPTKANFAEGVLAEKLPGEMKECIVYLPLYNGIKKMTIGFDPGSEIQAPEPFAFPHPVLFYGSSITQGGCASRPGNAYTHFLTRWLNADLINLGFSGSGRGEEIVARTIASLKLSAFVMDYDHNAPDIEHLENTHEKFFRIIREKQPELPVLMISKCDFDPAPVENKARREIIRKTYDNAVAAGDKNVYFVDGETLFGKTDRSACTVDGCHPNDIGFLRMAENILPTLKKALGK